MQCACNMEPRLWFQISAGLLLQLPRTEKSNILVTDVIPHNHVSYAMGWIFRSTGGARHCIKAPNTAVLPSCFSHQRTHRYRRSMTRGRYWLSLPYSSAAPPRIISSPAMDKDTEVRDLDIRPSWPRQVTSCTTTSEVELSFHMQPASLAAFRRIC